MAVYTLSELKNRITDRIYENHERAISGPDLQEILHDIIDSLTGTPIVGTIDVGLRAGTVELQPGLNGITFSEPMPEGVDYIVLTHIISYADIHQVGGIISDQLQSGFSITVDERSTLYYHAVATP